MTKLSRKERRKQGNFVPQYNGKGPITFTQYIEGCKSLTRKLKQHPLNKEAK